MSFVIHSISIESIKNRGEGMFDEKEVKVLIERYNAVENHKDRLVELIEEFCRDREKRYGQAVPQDNNQFGNTQFQELAGKANATKSVNEIKNFIRYQIGRGRGWRQDNFGEELLGQLGKVAELAGTDSELHIQLVRLYLGYLNRHVRYLREVAKDARGERR